MTHVITQRCCNDAACVPVCPVNCIHPTPDEPDYLTAEMLYIDPQVCIDCGACVSVCPVSAILPDFDLEPEQDIFETVNAAYFEVPGRRDYTPLPIPVVGRTVTRTDTPLRVAVVGAGPAASYVVEDLLRIRSLEVRIDVFERLPVPGGLARFGVAPDHAHTKDILNRFDSALKRDKVRLFLDVEVGTDISHEQLAERYSAVVYASGASASRDLGIPGDELPGSQAAPDFVAWYNGHPDFAAASFDLSGSRAVVIGNGNVALDVARILASDPETLATTDIADHALEALRASAVREVVVLGRRDASHAAFTLSELIGLQQHDDFDVVVELGDDQPAELDSFGELKHEQIRSLADVPGTKERRIVLRFQATPLRLAGTDRVEGVEVTAGEHAEVLETPTVIRSIGYRGRVIDGVPFDQTRGIIPNIAGRVIDATTGDPLPGVFAAGWIKRGASGVMGSNKRDAGLTVDALISDWESGLLGPGLPGDDLVELLPDAIDYAGWSQIDKQERAAGRAEGRPRVKIVETALLRSAAYGVNAAS